MFSILLAVLVLVGAPLMAPVPQPQPEPSARPHNTLTDAERAEGWELLFDGKSMEKWRGFKRDDMPGGWQVVDGCMTRVEQGGDIITRDVFADFELAIEWNISRAGNSGILFHVQEGDYGAVWQTGPEMQVLDNEAFRDRLDPKTSAGANYALHAPIRDVSRPAGEFNEARIIVRGRHIQYWLNGIKIVEFEKYSEDWNERIATSKFADMPGFAKYSRGHIALQDHGNRVQFRNIRIRRLD